MVHLAAFGSPAILCRRPEGFFAILAMIAALRFGLLTLIVSFAAAMILNGTPATLYPSAWYFPSFAADALIIAATAAVAFRLAISPPRARASTIRA